jgi:anti-anti-sigma factor
MLQVSYQDRDGVRIVLLKGEAGVAEAQELASIMIELAASRPKKLVLDLSLLTFISSLALGEMAALANSLRRFESRLAIAAAAPLIGGAIRRVRLDKSYEVFGSLDAAVAELNNQEPLWFVLKQPAGGRSTATP